MEEGGALVNGYGVMGKVEDVWNFSSDFGGLICYI